MTHYRKTKIAFITGTHLIQFKGYYELDLVNEFNSKRWVFHIPKELFDMMIFTKEKVKIIPRQREKQLPKEVPMMTS